MSALLFMLESVPILFLVLTQKNVLNGIFLEKVCKRTFYVLYAALELPMGHTLQNSGSYGVQSVYTPSGHITVSKHTSYQRFTVSWQPSQIDVYCKAGGNHKGQFIRGSVWENTSCCQFL